jgi:hypothetical protein
MEEFFRPPVFGKAFTSISVLTWDLNIVETPAKPEYHCPMITAPVRVLIVFILASGASAQVVVPATPKKFATRPIEGGGGASIGGVEVLPRDGAKDQNVRFTTHIVLSTSRLWTSTEGKLLEGKLIAFEDLVVEAPKGVTPQSPTPPESPTVVREDKVRLLVKQKPVEIPIKRLSQGDQEFIEQVRKSYIRKSPPTP